MLINVLGNVKTKQYIFEQVSTVIETVGPEKISIVVLDGAVRHSLELVEEKYPKIFGLICAAHALDLLMEDLIEKGDLEWIASMLEQCTSIVQLINNHCHVLSLWREFSPGKGLLKPSAVRFGITCS